VPQLLGAVAALALYAAGCYIAIVYLVGPVWPYLLVGAAGAGVLLVAAVLVAALLGVPRFAADPVRPAALADRLPATRTRFPRDPAWANYLFAQSRADLRAAAAGTAELVGRVWRAMVRGVRAEPMALVLWPVLLIPVIAAAGFTAAAALAGVLLYGLVAAVLAVAAVGWLAVVGALRGGDAGVRRLRRAKATCHHPGCNHRSTLPAFRCACGRVHHDIRPGLLGAAVRRCECGRLLPTTVLGAAATLTALCQACGRPLRPGAAVLTDVVLPVFGPASAGKTRLVLAGMVALSRHLGAVGGALDPVGAESKATFMDAGEVARPDGRTTKTDAGQHPAAITVRLALARRTALLHLFDAAGELYADREQSRELRFLDDTQGLVFVLDPFSIPAVADDLRGPLPDHLAAAQPAAEPPEDSYLITAQWLRDQGADLARLPLAVAVVKADLLLGLPPAAGLTADADSADVEAWLRAKHLDNMVDGAQRDFGAVRFHLVSSLDPGTDVAGLVGPTSPARPLLWLLGRSGVAVPEVVAG
jgi:hypothetical protein